MSLYHSLAPFVVCVAVFVDAAPGQTSPSDQLTRLIDEAWDFDMREQPLFATRVGDHRFNDRLPSVSVADSQRRRKTKQAFLKRLAAIDRAKLPRSDQINYDIFRRLTANEVREYGFKSYLIPITNRAGFHISFPELRRSAPLKTTVDYENYIARLKAFDRYARQHVEIMRVGIKQGIVLPDIVLAGFRAPIETHLVDDPTESLLYEPFRKFPQSVSQQQQKRLAAAGRKAIIESVVPGYRRFLTFMEKEYIPAARGSIGASALPGGRAFYRHRVRKYTTLDLSPEQVHQTGLIEVKRIRAEMQQIIEKVKFKGDHAAFIKHLRTDPRFYPKTPEQLMKEVAFILKQMDGELPRLFKTLPRTPYGLRRIPDYIAPRTTSAYYQQPAGDGSRGGFYYLNTYNLKSRPLFEMEALSFHEAVPGHHLQLALQQEMTGLPKFRRFAGFTAFVEGWALYAERLGLEVGFYQDPYSDFGRLSFEMWRACRLVVDTGIHYFGWTRQQAINYMAANTALSLHNITAEVDRYISWPGQALAYKTGELKIRELRARAEKKLGKAFDIREFHEIILGSGSVPLGVLEENVDEYIEAALKP